MLKLDHTKASTAASCMRKYQLRWIMNLEGQYGSTALRYGVAFHAAMEGFYSYVVKNGWDNDGGGIHAALMNAREAWDDETRDKIFYDDYRSFDNLVISLTEYMARFASDDQFMKIFNVERGFKLKMEPSRQEGLLLGTVPFYFTGRIDMELELNGLPWIKEFKTTGQALSLQQDRLHRSPQVLGYNYAAMQSLDTPPTGSLITMHHLSAYKSKVTGQYGKPKIDFSRVPQAYSTRDLKDWRYYFMGLATRIQLAEEADFFPKDLNSCRTFGKCPYFDLCEFYGHDVPNLERDNLLGFSVNDDPWHTLKTIDPEKVIIKEEDEFYAKC